MTNARDGRVQLYFLTTPSTTGVFWILDLTTSNGKRSDLENDTEITSIPHNVSPHSSFQSVVEGQNTFFLDYLSHNIAHTIVLRGLVLQPDFHQLKWDHNKRLSRTSSGSGQDRQRLGHLTHTKSTLINFTPFVIGGKLGGPLWGLHQNWGSNTTVESRRSFILDDFCQTVDNTRIFSFTSSTHLKLDSRLDHIQWVHDQNLRDTGNGTGKKLIGKWQGPLIRHILYFEESSRNLFKNIYT
ncbi:hypothetical protein OGATHE_002450 [Ogataea polymorpha]|uniref:Uncharacterized protein n=1 Tax=Ogataea polymorpha TaxID=460523 RepID=A0A9P8PCA6_9ASCO|nr:hypothetical protein OGATHE_002450 [Ogataea polymorpha]